MARVRRARLRDIAEALGLSVNSVSRALGDKDNIGEETKARVRAEAERLGYVPNSLARSLVTGSSMTLGLILTNPSNPMYAQLIAVVEEGARREGYSLLLATSQDTAEREAKAVEMLLRSRVDGVLVVPVEASHEHLARLRDAGIPVVFVSRDLPAIHADFVGGDNVAGAYEATSHLIRLGHRRIALVMEDVAVSSIRRRVQGFRQAMADAALDVDESLVFAVPSSRSRSEGPLWSPEGAYEVARGLADIRDRPTAMFVVNDFFALGIYRGLAEVGIRIPDDVAVVGFNDFIFARYLIPPLTTVRLPIDEIGGTALRLLLSRLRGKGEDKTPQKILLRPRLIVRSSCGSTPGGGSSPSKQSQEHLEP